MAGMGKKGVPPTTKDKVAGNDQRLSAIINTAIAGLKE